MSKITELHCYVEVTGEASDEDDEGVQGFYLVQLKLSRTVSLDELSEAEQSEIAKAVLDSFHEHQGISVLDDFEISVFLPNGEEVMEEDDIEETGLVAHADHQGQVNEDDLPFPSQDELVPDTER